MPRLIAIKSHSHFQGNTGVVIPLIIEEDNSAPREVFPEEFQNGNRLFIADDYQAKVDENYKDDELFVIASWSETDRDDWKTASNKQRYISYGNLVRPLEKSAYLPIVDMDMPDISTGTVDSVPSASLTNLHFMIHKDGFVSGPFTAQHNGSGWSISPVLVSTPLSLQNYNIAQYEMKNLIDAGLILHVSMNGQPRRFLSSLERAKYVEHDIKDYISDTALISYYTKNGFGKQDKNTLSRNEAGKLRAAVENYRKTNKALENPDRLNRLMEMLDSYLSFEGVGIDIVNNYLSNTPDGKVFLSEFVREKSDLLLKDKSEELRKRFEEQKRTIDFELSKLATEIEQKRQDLKLEEKKVQEQQVISAKEIEEIKKKTAAQIKEESLRGQEELREEIRKLEFRRDDIEEEIQKLAVEFDDITRSLRLPKEIQRIEFTLEERQRHLDELNKKSYEVERLVKKQMITLSSPDLSETMVAHKTISQILNGQTAIVSAEIKPFCPSFSSRRLGEDDRGDYIENLKNQLACEEGRHFHYDEIGNIVICLMQSFLTILAGPPGTGKTSTATRLAKHMGLIDNSRKEAGGVDRFLNIPVGRGWVSNRDLLGFWNGLKSIYQPSRSGLYEFMRAAEKNEKDASGDYLNLVLLDEANLSSIEHYWSDFLNLCDTFNNLGNKINLGIQGAEKQYIQVPPSLRFFATINSDETTERLSPRLIDRAPVITLAHSQFNLPADVVGSSLYDGAISFSDLSVAFNPMDIGFSLSDVEEGNLKSITSILSSGHNRAAPIYISPRKIQSIRRYCQTANELFFQRYQAMDFAISQHILPLISGYGKGYRDRLNQLHQKLGDCNYEISRQILNGIIERGDEVMDSYSFF